MSSTVIDLSWDKEENALASAQLAIKAAVLQNKARPPFVVIGTKKQLLPLNLPQLKALVCDENTHVKTLTDFSVEHDEFTLLVPEAGHEELLDSALINAVFGTGRYFCAYWLENLAQKRVFLAYAPFADVATEFKIFADQLKLDVYAFQTNEFKLAELANIAGIIMGDEPTIKFLIEFSDVVSQEMKEQFKKGRNSLAGFLAQGAFAPIPKPLKNFFDPRGFVVTNGHKIIVSLTSPADIKVIGKFLEKGFD